MSKLKELKDYLERSNRRILQPEVTLKVIVDDSLILLQQIKEEHEAQLSQAGAIAIANCGYFECEVRSSATYYEAEYNDLCQQVRGLACRIDRAAKDHRGPLCFMDLADEMRKLVKNGK